MSTDQTNQETESGSTDCCVAKSCDRCHSMSCLVPEREFLFQIEDEDFCECENCGLHGAIVFHGAYCGEYFEDQFDVQWLCPDTGNNY